MNEDLPPKQATVQVPGVKVEVTKEDNWQTIGLLVFAVLAIYLGIKTINRVFKK